MTAQETALLVLAVLLQAPVAFRLGSVVRDGRERAAGFLYLALGTVVAAIVCFFSRSPILAVFAACGLTVILAHARFMSLYTAPHPADRTAAPLPAAAPEDMLSAPAHPHAPVDPIRSGMAFIADVMATADRIGEFRHRRRMRRAEYARTVQQAAAAEEGNRKERGRQERPATHIRINPSPDARKLPPP